MTIDEAINWFGNMNRISTALGIAPQNTTKWLKQGYIPWRQQFRLSLLTEGKLPPDDQDPRWVHTANLNN